MKLENKTVLITGASRGIGRAIALAMAQEGAHVIVNYRVNTQKAEEVISLIGAGKAYAVQADVSKEDQVRSLVSETLLHFGKIDVLVNNVGAMISPGDWKSDVMTWHQTVDMNLTSTWLMIREVAPYMLKRGKGVIVNIGSIYGLLGAAGMLAYTSAKGGLITLTKAFAKELAPSVRVNAILPSYVVTDMARGAGDQLIEQFRKGTALQRIAMPEEVAKPAVFLASDDASYVTGEALVVDGGYSLR